MWIATIIRAFKAWRRYRVSLRELSQLDDRMLADIGVHRAQIRPKAWELSRG